MLFKLIQILVVSLACVAASVEHLHALQAERYQLPAFRLWLSRGHERLLKENVLWAFVLALLSVYLPVLLSMFMSVAEVRVNLSNWLLLAVFALLMARIAWRDYTAPSRKPFVVTRRILRLSLVLWLLCFAVTALGALLLHIPAYFLFAGMPYLVLLAARIIEPYELRLNEKYFKRAKRKIRKCKDLITIGITGSFGKTQTKFILRDILSAKYSVLATPASFNTPMGLSRVINDDLEPGHRVFIAEMGAQHVGDIRKLVELVRPSRGILTGIGAQHLDTFGSMENIAGTKYELMRGLPKDGFAVFGSGDDYIDRLFARCTREKCRVSLEKEEDSTLWAERIEYSGKGTSFMLWHRDGACIPCRTKLLGRYAVKDILLAAAMALNLGMTLEEIAAALPNVEPREHRLQLLPEGEDGLVMIDDTLNEDAETAYEAARVLARMPGRRIAVTPGVGEQAGNEKDVNYALGTELADGADTVILVGHRSFSRSLVRGLMEAGFSASSLHTVDDSEAADELLRELSEPGDTVLFESSIPDYEAEEE